MKKGQQNIINNFLGLLYLQQQEMNYFSSYLFISSFIFFILSFPQLPILSSSSDSCFLPLISISVDSRMKIESECTLLTYSLYHLFVINQYLYSWAVTYHLRSTVCLTAVYWSEIHSCLSIIDIFIRLFVKDYQDVKFCD